MGADPTTRGSHPPAPKRTHRKPLVVPVLEGVQIGLHVRVTTEGLARRLSPPQISAFMDGVARLVVAEQTRHDGG